MPITATDYYNKLWAICSDYAPRQCRPWRHRPNL